MNLCENKDFCLFQRRCILGIVPSGPFGRSFGLYVTPQSDTILIDESNKK